MKKICLRIICAFVVCAICAMTPAQCATQKKDTTKARINDAKYFKLKKPRRAMRKNLTKSAKSNDLENPKDTQETEILKDELAQDSITRLVDSAPNENSDEMTKKKRNLIGDLLHIYVSSGILGGSATHTSNKNSMSKEVPTCPNQLCRGDTTSATYQGALAKGYTIEIGVEHFFDKFDILGVRLFGDFSSKNGGLGKLVAGSSTRDTSTNNIPNGGIDIIDSSNPNNVKTDNFTFDKTPQPSESLQGTLADNGTFMTFGIGGDIVLNAPIDYWLRKAVGAEKSWWKNRLAYLRMGVFFGGGIEFGRYTQGSNSNKTFKNELASAQNGEYKGGKASNLDDVFFASGSGGFLRYGVSVYITRFWRANLGYKHNFYSIATERWYGYNGLQCQISGSTCTAGAVREDDAKSETLFRQKYVLSRENEWFLNFTLSF